MKKPIPIGVENYKTMIENNYYYIDKTCMIKELSEQKGTVNLFTRPRRFGKTLTLSMIRTFFEDERTAQGEKIDNSRYFEGRHIMEAGNKYISQMGQYPVIKLSLKSARQPEFDMAYNCLKGEIADEFERHSYVLEGNKLPVGYEERYHEIRNRTAGKSSYATALKFLSQCLKHYHGKNAIILIDEYDVPLENAYFEGFYDKMIGYIRSLFESALKTNDALEFGVITGCLRISRESIFTGLNNLEINSILSNPYAEYFGFTEPEVEHMLKAYGLSEKFPEVRQWYDGYIFGETEVYNPWSIINYVKTATLDSKAFPKPYWSNTSSNSIIRDLVERADGKTKAEIEKLIDGQTIEKPVHEDITYEDIHKTQDNLWNFLFFTGYLKVTDKRFEEDTIYLTMSIPNSEVRYVYRNTIKDWFDRQMKGLDLPSLYNALCMGNAEDVENFLCDMLLGSISYYDKRESFYHGVMPGVLSAIPDYRIESNREYGNGRPDIVLCPFNPKKPVIILELKHCKKFTEMETGCMDALKQMEVRHYAEPFIEKGYSSILRYGICFCEKVCAVRVEAEMVDC